MPAHNDYLNGDFEIVLHHGGIGFWDCTYHASGSDCYRVSFENSVHSKEIHLALHCEAVMYSSAQGRDTDMDPNCFRDASYVTVLATS